MNFQKQNVVTESKYPVLIMINTSPWDSTPKNKINGMEELCILKHQHISIGKGSGE